MTDPVQVTTTIETKVSATPSRPDNWITLLVVGGLMALGIVATAFALVGRNWGLFCLALALYEAWTLVNAYKADTISEAIWIYAHRPLVPLLFGLAFGVAMGCGYLGDVRTVGRAFAVGLVYGHLFFGRQADNTAITVTRGTVDPAPLEAR